MRFVGGRFLAVGWFMVVVRARFFPMFFMAGMVDAMMGWGFQFLGYGELRFGFVWVGEEILGFEIYWWEVSGCWVVLVWSGLWWWFGTPWGFMDEELLMLFGFWEFDRVTMLACRSCFDLRSCW